MKITKKTYVLLALWLLVIASFLATQLTNDFFVFWAYGRFVSNSELSGIPALIETWELKGLLFKAYLYAEYVLTALFSTSFDVNGQFIYKLFGIIPYLGILCLSIYTLPDEYVKNIEKKNLFFIVSVLFLAVHFASHFQAEMWGVAMLLLALALYLHEGWKWKVVSAFIYSLTFYLKSPIPLLGGSLVITSIMLKQQSPKGAIKDILPFAITTMLFLSITLLLIRTFYPQEIIDIWNASYYQHTLFHESSNIKSACIRFVIGWKNAVLYNPVTAIGILAALILSYCWIIRKSWMSILFLLAMWVFPMLYIIISNCFFVYHYYLLVYPSTLSLMLLLNNDIHIKKWIVVFLSLLFFVYYIFVLSAICPTNIFAKKQYADYLKKMEATENLYVGSKLGSGEVLFLDAGEGAFIFNNKSYLRYFYPLPLQRISANDKFVNLETYKAEKRKVLSYKGEYITLAKDWFLREGNNQDVYDMIIEDYILYKRIAFSEYSWLLFKNDPSITTLLIYKKKKSDI